jgi:hypothetical protein
VQHFLFCVRKKFHPDERPWRQFDYHTPLVREGRVKPKLKLSPDVTPESPVIIIGAGIAGVACVLALADLNLKTVLLDGRSR